MSSDRGHGRRRESGECMPRLLFGLTTTLLGALIVVSLGTGASNTVTFGVKAVLDARQEMPRQAVKVPWARGVLSGTLSSGGATGKIAWRLTSTDLSGRALEGHIHLGKLGKAGPVAITLCAPCHSNMHGTTHVTAKVVRVIRNGSAYVDLHTRKNPNGEIRGQIRLIQGS